MSEKKKQVHLFLSERTYDALKCCCSERGGSMNYYVSRALQIFLLKGDYYRKAEKKCIKL